MKTRLLAITFAAVSLAALTFLRPAKPPARSALPTPSAAKTILNSTHRHREWVNVPAGDATVSAFIVYPERSDRAPVVMVTASQQGASDWVRAVSDQLAAEGFIAVAPDVLSNKHWIDAVRAYAVALPAASGVSASLELDANVTAEAWWRTVAYLNSQTGNQPVFGTNPNVPEDHSTHIMMAMAQATSDVQPPAAGPRGYPQGKLPELPAGIFTAKSTLLHSPLRKEFVDIPAGSVKLHTWVEYPAGNDKAPVVVVMQHGPGLDDWQRALADQLAREGLEEITAEGAFDPHIHEALLSQPGEGAEPGTVLQVVQKGYRLGDRVLRPARVVISE